MDPAALAEMTASVVKHCILQPILFRIDEATPIVVASKLGNLDTSAWTEDEKNAFNQTLQNLEGAIQAMLNPPQAASSNLA